MPLKGKDAFKARLRGSADKFVRAVGLEGASRLIRRTPVDKGRARGNWNTAVGAPDLGEDAETTDKGGGQTIQKASAVILGEFRAGERLFVTNSVPYIGELEGGSSRQAPEGMVAVTKAEMKPLVAKVAAKIAAGGDAL